MFFTALLTCLHVIFACNLSLATVDIKFAEFLSYRIQQITNKELIDK